MTNRPTGMRVVEGIPSSAQLHKCRVLPENVWPCGFRKGNLPTWNKFRNAAG